VAVVNFLVKRSEIAFIVISELAAGFVPSGPKFCSRPFYCPRAAVENFVTFTSRCCVFEGKNSIFFVVLLLDVIYNVTAWISNQSLRYFPNFFDKFGIIKLYNHDPPFYKKLQFIHTYISRPKILATSNQLSYEVIPQFGKAL
jgi:hypothetical protein